MTNYAEMAQELMGAMDASRRLPPHDGLSQATRGEMAVLRLLDTRARRLGAGDISKGLSMTTSRVAAVLNSLEKKGMIVRGADAKDRRRVSVGLTQDGEAFCRERRADARDSLSHLLERLGEEDARRFVDLLKRVLAILEEEGGSFGRQGGIK